MRRRMSPWNANLTQQEYESEVLDRRESAVCKRIEVRISRAEDAPVNRWVKVSPENLEYGYVDLTEASEDEKCEYEECQRKVALRPPDEVWYFIVRKRDAARLERLSTFDAQCASLGYSKVSEAEAWREAWGKLKLEEDMMRTLYILLIIVACLVCFILVFFGFGPNEPPVDPLGYP